MIRNAFNATCHNCGSVVKPYRHGGETADPAFSLGRIFQNFKLIICKILFFPSFVFIQMEANFIVISTAKETV